VSADVIRCEQCNRQQLVYHALHAPNGISYSDARKIGWDLKPLDGRTLCPFCRKKKAASS
jgi:hypothetical protein